jgi:hypothetical protein
MQLVTPRSQLTSLALQCVHCLAWQAPAAAAAAAAAGLLQLLPHRHAAAGADEEAA